MRYWLLVSSFALGTWGGGAVGAEYLPLDPGLSPVAEPTPVQVAQSSPSPSREAGTSGAAQEPKQSEKKQEPEAKGGEKKGAEEVPVEEAKKPKSPYHFNALGD